MPCPRQLKPPLTPSVFAIGPLTMSHTATGLVVACMPCRLNSGSATASAAAISTGRYSGSQPAITRVDRDALDGRRAEAGRDRARRPRRGARVRAASMRSTRSTRRRHDRQAVAPAPLAVEPVDRVEIVGDFERAPRAARVCWFAAASLRAPPVTQAARCRRRTSPRCSRTSSRVRMPNGCGITAIGSSGSPSARACARPSVTNAVEQTVTRGRAALRDFYTVVDTPRRAGPSVARAGDDQVAFARESSSITASGAGTDADALAALDDRARRRSVLDQQLGEIVDEMIEIGLGVVDEADDLAREARQRACCVLLRRAPCAAPSGRKSHVCRFMASLLQVTCR